MKRNKLFKFTSKLIFSFMTIGCLVSCGTASPSGSYTVTWKNWDGSILEIDNNVQVESFPSYDGLTPSRTGTDQYTYTFDKWSPELTSVTGDCTYVALFTEKVNTYTVTWVDEDGTVLEVDKNVSYGSYPSFNGEIPDKESTNENSYYFSGWSPTLDIVTGNQTYTAKYNSEPIYYHVTWTVDGSESKETYLYGETPTYKLGTPTKDNDESGSFTFIGWDKTISPVVGDVTYTAQFEYSLDTFTITWLNYDNSILETDYNVQYGSLPSYDSETPTKSSDDKYNYTFSGWDKLVEPATGNQNYVAQYSKTQYAYQINFNLNGGTSDSYVNSKIVTDINSSDFFFDVTKSGYCFKGWVYLGVLVFNNIGLKVSDVELQEGMTFDAWYSDKAIINVYTNNESAGNHTTSFESPFYQVVNLTATVNDGYNFDGWYAYNPTTAKFDIFLSNSLNYSYTIWEEGIDVCATYSYKSYTLSISTNNFELGGVYDSSCPNKGIYESLSIAHEFNSPITLTAITKNSQYEFIGWYNSSGYLCCKNPSYNLCMSNFDTELIAKWNLFNINYELDGGENNLDNPNSYSNGNEIELLPASKQYYDFAGWYLNGNKVTSISSDLVGDITLTASWTPISYQINYDLNGGNSNNNPSSYNIETPTFTLSNPSRVGYQFDGWYEDEVKVSDIKCGSVGDRYFIAHWTPIVYNIFYDTVGGTLSSNAPTTYTIETPTTYLIMPQKTGYACAYWVDQNKNILIQIVQGSTGDLYLTAAWGICSYSVNVKSDSSLKGTVSGKGTYPYGTSVKLVATPKTGYMLEGWYLNDIKVSDEEEYIYIVPAETNTFIAKFTAISYSITYDLDGGEFRNVNPTTSYTIEDFVSFYAPYKTGYSFAGWKDNDGNTVTLIRRGNTGDVTLKATWSINSYSVYATSSSASKGSVSGSGTYEYGSLATVEAYPADGYEFAGWDDRSGTLINENPYTFTLKGDAYLQARFAPIEYTISYIHDKGDNHQFNRTKYTIESQTFDIFPADGYYHDFVKWVDQNGNEVSSVKEGSFGNLILTAIYTPRVYSITYDDLYDGVNNESNPSSYTIESEDITLLSPTRDGYIFKYWYVEDNNEITSIPTGSYGDLNINAKWEAIQYTITYELDGGINGVNNPEYYFVSSCDNILNNPYKEGYSFIKWVDQNDNEVTCIKTGTIGDITLTAIWSINSYDLVIDSESTHKGSVSGSGNYDFGTIVTITATANDGYEFSGWYINNWLISTSISYVYEITTEPTTIIAKFNPITYTVTYKLNDGINNNLNPTTYTIESPSILLLNPSKVGYTFNCWKVDNKEVIVNIPAGSFGNLVLYAIFDINSHMVFVNSNNSTRGLVTGGGTYEYGSSYDLLAHPYNGYVFEGWYVDGVKVSSLESDSFIMGDENITYTANFIEKEYSITYVLNGGTNNVANISTYTISSEASLLLPATKDYYDFICWQDKDGNNVTNIPVDLLEDIVLEAMFIPTEYTITYVLDGGENDATNITKYTIKSNDFTFKAPSKVGYTFDGWYLNDTKVSCLSECGYKDLYLNAKWSLVNYNIIYELDGGSNDPSNPKTYTIENEKVYLNAPSKTGYTFTGWEDANGNSITFISVGRTGEFTLYATWEINSYNVYVKNETPTRGSVSNNKKYTYGSQVKVEATSNNGYVFIGWYINNELVSSDATYTFEVPAYDVHLVAKFNIKVYNITYILHDGTNYYYNPSTYTIETDTFTLGTCQKENYIFQYWLDQNGNQVKEVVKGSTGDLILDAILTPAAYTISYSLKGGKNHPDNPIFVTVESPDIYLKDPTRDGYIFVNWTDTNGDVVTYIPAGTTFHRQYFANWKAIEYSISYTLNGGTNNSSNPNKYTIENKDIILANASKQHYNFVKWIDNNGVTVTTIASGSMGNITLTAVYEPVVYTITYTLNGGTNNSNNPTSYTVESSLITLYSPTRDYYTFLGWTYSSSAYVSSIDPSLGVNINLKAHWSPISYTISYVLNGGTNYEYNPTKYSVESGNVYITNATKLHYNFVKWVDSEGNTITYIPSGSHGDITLTAIFNPIEYSITYYLDGGINNSKNPSSYTVETTMFVLKKPTKDGYTFTGWTDIYGNAVSLINPADCIDIVVYAIWSGNDYNITYDLDGGYFDSTYPETYNITTGTTLPTPCKTGSTFSHWIDGDGNQVDYINSGTYGDISLKAIWTLNYCYVTATSEDTDYGNVTGSGQFEYGSSVTVKAIANDGYKFSYWEIDGCNVSSDATYTFTITSTNVSICAHFEVIIYNINYILPYGQTYNQDYYSIETSTITLDDAYFDCDIFDGWYLDSSYTQRVTSITPQNKDLTIYGKWCGLKDYCFTNNNGQLTIYGFSNYCTNRKTINLANLLDGVKTRELTIVGIGDSAFSYNSDLVSVTLPNTLLFINNCAFYQCESLSSITIPNSVTSIGEAVFYMCSSLTSIQLPNKLTKLSASLFEICTSLKSIEIPTSVNTIGWKCFANCTSLTSITLTNNITTMDSDVFSDCSNLLIYTALESRPSGWNSNFAGNTTVLWGYIGKGSSGVLNYYLGKVNGVTSAIIYGVNDTTATSITIPSTINYNGTNYNVTAIGTSALVNCSSLKKLYLTNSLKINNNSIGNTSSSINIYVDSLATWLNMDIVSSNSFKGLYNLYINNVLLTDLVIPSNVTTIKDYAFSFCNSISSVYIPNTVTNIGQQIFIYSQLACVIHCQNTSQPSGWSSGWNSTYLPVVWGYASSGVSGNYKYEIYNTGSGNTLGIFGFTDDTATSVTLPSTINVSGINYPVKVIGQFTFYYNDNLTEVILPEGVTTIQLGAFMYCNALQQVVIPTSVTSIDNNSFCECRNLTILCKSESKPSSWVSNWNMSYGTTYPVVWGYQETYTSDYINYTISSIGGSRYAIVTGYTNKTANNLTIPSMISVSGSLVTVNEIADKAFYNCSNLISISLPSTITKIGNNAFASCSSLNTISIPSSVTSIGYFAFSNCVSLKSISIPSSVTSMGYDVFSQCIQIAIYCEMNSQPSSWNDNWNTIYVEDNYYYFKAPVVWGTTSQGVTGNVKYGVSSVSGSPAVYITGLDDITATSITIPSTIGGIPVTTICSGAFYFREILESLYIPTSITKIEQYMAPGCFNLIIYCYGSGPASSWHEDWNIYNCPTIWYYEGYNSTYNGLKYAVSNNGKERYITITGVSDYSLTSINIPSSIYVNGSYLPVRIIGSSAFEHIGDSLESVTLPDSLTYIGTCAFSCCVKLSSITIRGSVDIGNSAFQGCESLTEVRLVNGVKTIGRSAFTHCYNLEKVIIPDSVTFIDNYAFNYCTSVTVYTSQESSEGFADNWNVVYRNPVVYCNVHYCYDIESI